MQKTKLKSAAIVGGTGLISAGARQILVDIGFIVTAIDREDRELIADVAAVSPELILVVSQSGPGALRIAGQLRRKFTGARLLVLADTCHADDVARAWHLGIDGYLVKGFSCALLANAIQLVANGERYFPAAALEALPGFNQAMAAASFDDDCAAALLSHREVETLMLLSDGVPNKTVADKLAISEDTVKVHVKAILRKLGLRNRTQAAAWAVHRGVDNIQLHGAAPPSVARQSITH